MQVVKLNSDNFEGSLLTPEAYKEVTLQMSTGDFHTHKHETIEVEDYTDVITLPDLYGGALPEDLRDLYSDKCEVLKQNRVSDILGVVLYRSGELSYFSKSGKARLKMNITYTVEVWAGLDHPQAQGSVYRLKNKQDALKAYRDALSQYRTE